MTKKQKQMLSVLIPLLILLGMTFVPLKTLLVGEEILLETRPLDPRDLFRGDYVTLSYAIEEIDFEKVEPTLADQLLFSSFPYNSPLFVELKMENGIFTVKNVTDKKPAGSVIYLKARYNYVENFKPSSSSEKPKLMVQYSFDRYFVEENTGMALEEAARKGELLAKVKVSKGYGLLREIIIKK